MNLTTAIQGSVAAKLKVARQGAGLSTREVAKRLERSFPISHASVSNYEKGQGQPTLALLAVLAELYGRPINWFLERGPALTGIRYRNRPSKLRVSDRHRFEAQALQWIEAYMRIEEYLNEPLVPKCVAPAIPPHPVNPGEFASHIRKVLACPKDAPIRSVIDSLEAFGIRVIELHTDLAIDGIAAMLGTQPVVVLKSNCPSDRQRLNAAHELFHVLLGHCADGTAEYEPVGENEDLAFACARHFLIPRSILEEAFKGQSFVKLVKHKEEWGISLSALIYAARQEKFLSENLARHLWIELSKRGWKVNEPGHVRPDRAVRFEHLVDRAKTEKNLTWNQVATVCGVREEELRQRVEFAMGIDPHASHGGEKQEGERAPFRGLRLAT